MSFIRKGILTSSGYMVGALLTMSGGILFSRVLGPAGMGKYSLFLSTITMSAGMLGLGLGSANVFLLNNQKFPLDDIVTHAVKTAIVLGAFFSIALTWAFLSFPGYFSDISVIMAVLMAMGGAAYMARFILSPILVAQFMARRMVVVNLVRPVVLLSAGGLLAVAGRLNPDNALLLLVFAFSVTLSLVLCYLWRHISFRRRFQRDLFAGLVVYAMKLSAASTLLALAREITVFLLRGLRPDDFAEVGFYTRAISICNLARMVPQAISPWLYAKWAGVRGGERTRQAEMAARVNLTYGLLVATGLVVLGKPLIRLLYGPEFIPAYVALRFLAPAMALMTLFIIYNQLLASDGRVSIAAYILAGTVIIMGGVTYLAASRIGMQGAALGMLSGNGFAVVAGMGVCWKLYGLNPLNCLFLRKKDMSYIRQAFRRKA